MTALVDTSVWSLVLRRRTGRLSTGQQAIRSEVNQLITQGQVGMIGPIRQELLSGISDLSLYARLRDRLRAFEDSPLVAEDYEDAAAVNNRCRSAGVSGSHIDFLICAAGMRRDWPILTIDRDFERYAKIVPIRLHLRDGEELPPARQ